MKKRLHPNESKKGVRSFVPPGRSGFCLYAVTLVDVPGVVKIGRTIRWKGRRREYACWNLRDGDGIDTEVVFEINEEWVALEALEGAVLGAIKLPRRHGNEWFCGGIQEARDVIACVLEDAGVCFTEQWAGLAAK